RLADGPAVSDRWKHPAAVRACTTEERVRHSALPVPRTCALRLPHRRASDRYHLAAGASDADRLLQPRQGRRRLTPRRPRPGRVQTEDAYGFGMAASNSLV